MQRALSTLQNVKPTETPGLKSIFSSHLPPLRGLHLPPAVTSTPQTVPKPRLRPYQEESISSILTYLSKGERRLGVSLATGSGKTVIFSNLISRVPAPTPQATQSLILAHRRELVEQAARHCHILYPEWTVDVEMGARHGSGNAEITVASVQSLMSGDRLSKYDPKKFKLVLVDEAHHIVAPRYMDVLRYFGLVGDKRGKAVETALVGFSATFSRLDGLRLGAAIDHIVYHKDYVAMIEDQWLSNATFTTVKLGVDLSRVKSARGDFVSRSLSEAINTDETNIITVRAWLEKAGTRKSTLVFCVDLAHVASLTAAFRQHGVDARSVTSATSLHVRAERLDDFKAGKFPVLLNCGIFTEGTDIPNIDCIVLARPTQSQNLLVQMIGRGLRKHAGKTDCHIIDMVASLQTGIVTTPTLFGLDPQTVVEHASTADMKHRREHSDIKRHREGEMYHEEDSELAATRLNGNITFTDYDTVNDLIKDTSGERHIRAISQYGWVQIDDKRYVLSNRDGSYVALTARDDVYVVTYARKLPATVSTSQPYAKLAEVATTATFTAGVNAADTFASEMFPFEFISKAARWRKSPASSGQIAYLNKFRGENEKLEEGSVAKGRAADWITKMKFGARGRFNRITQRNRKTERLEDRKEKFLEQQRRSRIDIGPVSW